MALDPATFERAKHKATDPKSPQLLLKHKAKKKKKNQSNTSSKNQTQTQTQSRAQTSNQKSPKSITHSHHRTHELNQKNPKSITHGHHSTTLRQRSATTASAAPRARAHASERKIVREMSEESYACRVRERD